MTFTIRPVSVPPAPTNFGRQLRPPEASHYRGVIKALYPDALFDTRLVFQQHQGGFWHEATEALRDEDAASPFIIQRRRYGVPSDEIIYRTGITQPDKVYTEIAMDNASGNRQSQVKFINPGVAVIRRHYPLK